MKYPTFIKKSRAKLQVIKYPNEEPFTLCGLHFGMKCSPIHHHYTICRLYYRSYIH